MGIETTNPLAGDLEHILDHTRPFWDELRGQQIFITGGTGFFGCWLVESFLWANERLKLDSAVTILTRSPETFVNKVPHLALSPVVTLLAGDVRKFKFPCSTFSHVIHAATDASAKLNKENPLLMLDTITEGTRRILDFSTVCGAKKFLLTSSGAVYGKQPSDITHITEDYPGGPDPFDPASAYGQGKRHAEQLCTLYASSSQVEMKIARCFAFVGPYLPMHIHFAIGNFIRDGLNGGPIIVKGDGNPRRSYLYAADLAIWLWTILFCGKHLRPYNVGSDESLSIAEVAQQVARQFHPQVPLEICGVSSPRALLEQYVPSIKRVKNELELSILIPFVEALQKTIQFNKDLN